MGHGDYRDFEITPNGLVEIIPPPVEIKEPETLSEKIAFHSAKQMDLMIREYVDKK